MGEGSANIVLMTSPLSEDDLIARYFAPIAGAGGLGLRDDAACIAAPRGCDLVLTKDAIVAGVHFFAEDPADAIARKALRVNVSDLAAKGADPLGFLMALALPASIEAEWIACFARGLGEDAARYSIPLLGGDTVRTPGPLTISITALGAVPHGSMAKRGGARAGDLIYVTGTIGDAALGLKLRLAEGPIGLTEKAREHLLNRYLEPHPRHQLRRIWREFANGAMDVSDGLVGDLTKMLKASGVGARVRLALTPLSDAAREAARIDSACFEIAVIGGDDYELLASVAPARAAAFELAAKDAGVPVTCIGEVIAGAGAPEFFDRDGVPKIFARGGYSHF